MGVKKSLYQEIDDQAERVTNLLSQSVLCLWLLRYRLEANLRAYFLRNRFIHSVILYETGHQPASIVFTPVFEFGWAQKSRLAVNKPSTRKGGSRHVFGYTSVLSPLKFLATQWICVSSATKSQTRSVKDCLERDTLSA